MKEIPVFSNQMDKVENHVQLRLSIYLCYLITAVTKDPCTHAQLLPSLAQRNIGYKLKAGEARICDYYLSEEWYKLGAGYSISNSNKDCGTTYPWHTSGNCYVLLASII